MDNKICVLERPFSTPRGKRHKSGCLLNGVLCSIDSFTAFYKLVLAQLKSLSGYSVLLVLI